MEKKTCESCGKTWISEKFDGHHCIPLPKKPRKTRATPTPSPKPKAGAANEGPPVIAFRRNM